MDDAQTDAPSVEIAEIPDTLRAVAINVRKHMADERMREVLAMELEDCAAALASPRATPEVHPDTVRLDWLDAQREAEWHAEQRSETEVEQVLDYFFWQTRGQCNDIRSAIDHDERRAKLPKPPMTDADSPF